MWIEKSYTVYTQKMIFKGLGNLLSVLFLLDECLLHLEEKTLIQLLGLSFPLVTFLEWSGKINLPINQLLCPSRLIWFFRAANTWVLLEENQTYLNKFRMLTNGLCCAGTGHLIQCLWLGLQSVIGGKFILWLLWYYSFRFGLILKCISSVKN